MSQWSSRPQMWVNCHLQPLQPSCFACRWTKWKEGRGCLWLVHPQLTQNSSTSLLPMESHSSPTATHATAYGGTDASPFLGAARNRRTPGKPPSRQRTPREARSPSQLQPRTRGRVTQPRTRPLIWHIEHQDNARHPQS